VPNPSPDYDLHAKEPVSVFGPGIAPGAENKNSVVSPGLERNGGKKTGSEIVSTEFETDDDLTTANLDQNPSTLLTTTTVHPKTEKHVSKDSVKKDYVDYDSDVTIPTNLQDLLANLPENINADNLQKMFRDSVDDRRALLQGFDMLINKMTKDEKTPGTSMPKPPETQKPVLKKSSGRMMPGDKIDTMHVTWESQRMARDLPISTDSKVPFGTPDPNGPPMIAGQLLIYDLDETPPNAVEEEAVREEQQRECAISRHGLMVLAMALGSVALACIFVIFVLSLKLRTKSKDSLLNSSFGSLPSISKSIPTNYSNVSVYRQPLTKNDSTICQRRPS
uniref:Uncharacterized protein n=1 Tax=Panagrolaimus sp. JU765 TaxID=591449 RepID=A0AC34Q6G7_9BILA